MVNIPDRNVLALTGLPMTTNSLLYKKQISLQTHFSPNSTKKNRLTAGHYLTLKTRR